MFYKDVLTSIFKNTFKPLFFLIHEGSKSSEWVKLENYNVVKKDIMTEVRTKQLTNERKRKTDKDDILCKRKDDNAIIGKDKAKTRRHSRN